MMWTGTKSDFWITMDDYGTVTLDRAAAAPGPAQRRRIVGHRGDRCGARLGSATAAAAIGDLGRDEERSPCARCRLRLAGRGAEIPVSARAASHWRAMSSFEFMDRWESIGATCSASIARSRSTGMRPGGFLSAATLQLSEPRDLAAGAVVRTRNDLRRVRYLTDTAIGGRAHYRPGDFTVRIREDRLPAPLVAAHFRGRLVAGRAQSGAARRHDRRRCRRRAGGAAGGRAISIRCDWGGGDAVSVDRGLLVPRDRGRSDLCRQHVSRRAAASMATTIPSDQGWPCAAL